MNKVQKKKEELLSYLRKYIAENGISPSIREICDSLGIKSTASCQTYLNELEKDGVISRGGGNKKRTIKLNDQLKTSFISVPVIGTVTAGQPIFAYESLDGYYPLPEEFGDEDETFILSVKGSSMIDAGILNGDKVIVKKTACADNGEIVVAFFDDGATVKRFFRKNGKVILHPENPTMDDIVLDDVTILGTVKGLIRKF